MLWRFHVLYRTCDGDAVSDVRCVGCVVQQGGTLKGMRELLHAGERLGVGVAATAALRARIRRREWEDSARKALSTKSSVAALAGACRLAAAGGLCTVCSCTHVTAVWDMLKATVWLWLLSLGLPQSKCGCQQYIRSSAASLMI
jgi:hypothetical protein